MRVTAGFFLHPAGEDATFGTDARWIPRSNAITNAAQTIAAESPALFNKIFNKTHILIGVASVLMWVLGNALFGISIIRAKTFSRWAGILLIVGTAIIPVAYLTGLSAHVVAVGGAIAAAGQVWLGYELQQ